ncbi:hypothetical protein ATANTOWER_014732 [Ataeniobius toweri]|uniref:Uncharacterized protein n=1 Tax=Ataeniobius toweri TaxID=208326 RepID=A0ABU7C8K3_9TELE|nr:hypothetical protein [Ataeniobius toweri]
MCQCFYVTEYSPSSQRFSELKDAGCFGVKLDAVRTFFSLKRPIKATCVCHGVDFSRGIVQLLSEEYIPLHESGFSLGEQVAVVNITNNPCERC